MLRALKTHARLIFTTFATTSFGELLATFISQLAEFNVVIDTSKERLTEMTRCETYLKQADYTDIQVHRTTWLALS